MQAISSSPSVRLPGLDTLRFVAVTLVIGRHFDPSWIYDGPFSSVLIAWRRGGWIGVDLFFVLSGFLVARLLFVEHQTRGRVRIGRFLWRRGMKIYPSFYLLILLTQAVEGSRSQLSAVVAELFFLQNYFGGIWNHTWSLAVEEHFYLLLAAGVGLLFPRYYRWFPLVLLSVLLVPLALRLSQPESSVLYLTNFKPTHLRIDSLAFGVVLAFASVYHSEKFFEACRQYQRPLTYAGVILLSFPFAIAVEGSGFINTWGFSVLYLGGGALLCGALGRRSSGIARWEQGLAYVGKYSYSIYLWHMPVYRWVMPAVSSAVDLGPTLSAGVFVLLSLGIGILAGRLVEYPVLRLRDRLWPSRTSVSPLS